MKALAKKSFSVSTIYDALTVSVQLLMNEGMTATQEYINDYAEYSPDWTIAPLIITPRAFIADPSGDNPLATYDPTPGSEVAETNIIANTTYFTNLTWHKVTDAGNILLSEGPDYSIATSGANRGALTVKKNLNISDGRTLLFTGTFIDSRTGMSQTVTKSVTLTCTASTITSLKSRLTTPKGVAFDLKTSYLPVVHKMFLGNEECQHDIVRWWEKDGVAIPASDIAYVDQDRVDSFVNRVVADGGVVRNEKHLRRILYAHRHWLSDTVMICAPDCGLKVVDNKIAKVYNVIGTNDFLQATAANRPYVGGVIATGEKAKIKLGYGASEHTLSINAITFGGAGSFCLYLNINLNSVKTGALTRLHLGGLYWILFDTNAIYITNTNQDVVTITYALVAGRNTTIVVNYENGQAWADIDGAPVSCFGSTGTMVMSRISSILSHSLDGQINALGLITRALSASESQSLHAFLANEFPAIEAVTVGSQRIATSNLEATVFGPVTIPEVQASAGVELITVEADRTFSSDTGFWPLVGATISGGALNITGGAKNFINGRNLYPTGKKCMWTIDVSSINPNGGALFFGLQLGVEDAINTAGIHYVIGTAVSASLYAWSTLGAAGNAVINSISCVELGWSDAQTIYDFRISAGDTVLQANIAACMWSKYNHDDAIAAINGKSYNDFAVKVMEAYPIEGWHVPSNTEAVQLKDYANSNGGKLKLNYNWRVGGDPITNELGVSLIPSGIRTSTGIFSSLTELSVFRLSNDDRTVSTNWQYNSIDNVISDRMIGTSVRLFADTPFTEPITDYYQGDTIVIPVTDADDGSGEVTVTCKAARITTDTIVDGGTTKATAEQIAKIGAGLWRPSVLPSVFDDAATLHTESVLLKYKMEDVLVDIVCPSAVKSNVKMVNPSVVLSNNLGVIVNPQERFSFKWVEKHHNGTQVITTDLGYGSSIMVPLVALSQNIEVEPKQGFEFVKYKLVPNGTSDTLVIPFDHIEVPNTRYIIDFIPAALTGEKILLFIGNTTRAIKVYTNGDMLMIKTDNAEYAIGTIPAMRTYLDFTVDMGAVSEVTAVSINGVAYTPDRSAAEWEVNITGLAKHIIADIIMYEDSVLTHRWTFAGESDTVRRQDKIGVIDLTTTATFQKL